MPKCYTIHNTLLKINAYRKLYLFWGAAEPRFPLVVPLISIGSATRYNRCRIHAPNESTRNKPSMPSHLRSVINVYLSLTNQPGVPKTETDFKVWVKFYTRHYRKSEFNKLGCFSSSSAYYFNNVIARV